MARAKRVDDPRGRGDHPALELGRGEAARPAVEQLHRIDPGLDLARQIIDRDRLDPVDDRGEFAGVEIGQAARLGLLAAALAGDHVGGDRPRAPGKAQEGRLRRQARP